MPGMGQQLVNESMKSVEFRLNTWWFVAGPPFLRVQCRAQSSMSALRVGEQQTGSRGQPSAAL